MLKRTISGAVFVATVAGFLLLRQFVDYRIFNILIWFFCSVGTFELARALQPFILKGGRLIISIFGFLFVPHFCIIEYFVKPSMGWLFALALVLLFIIITTIIAIYIKSGIKKCLVTMFAFLYPSLLLLCLLLINEMPFMLGFSGVLMVFVVASLADTFAYLVGMTYGKIKKGNVKKLCPKLSPNKTWAGAIGGVVGGIIGAILVCVIFKPQVNFFSPILLFALVGFFASIFTEIGDLFESFIKRKVGIKDMGEIMPGHGGVMDRIDGMVFASAVIFLVFVLVV